MRVCTERYEYLPAATTVGLSTCSPFVTAPSQSNCTIPVEEGDTVAATLHKVIFHTNGTPWCIQQRRCTLQGRCEPMGEASNHKNLCTIRVVHIAVNGTNGSGWNRPVWNHHREHLFTIYYINSMQYYSSTCMVYNKLFLPGLRPLGKGRIAITAGPWIHVDVLPPKMY